MILISILYFNILIFQYRNKDIETKIQILKSTFWAIKTIFDLFNLLTCFKLLGDLLLAATTDS